MGIVFFMGSSGWVHAFIRSVSCVVEWKRNNLHICHIALLVMVVFVCLERRWKHVSVSCSDMGCKGGRQLGGLDGVFSLVAHVLCVSQFECLWDLCINKLRC